MGVDNFQRQFAMKVSVSDVQLGSFVSGTEDQPTMLELRSGVRSGRVSIIATLVNAGDREGWIDDGSGLLQVRAFDSVIWPPVPSLVHVIGRVREYGGQRYVAVEIVRGISAGWAAFRKKELLVSASVCAPSTSGEVSVHQGADLVSVVDSLDAGSGADYEMIKTVLARSDADVIVQNALESGVVFQVAPGRLKVLR